MKIDTIRTALNGYFINRVSHNGLKVTDTLCKKIDNENYETLENVRTPNGTITAYEHLLNQVNNHLLDPTLAVCKLDEILPLINGNVFESYSMRERHIEKHLELLDMVQDVYNEYETDKFVVTWKKPKKTLYGIVDDDKLIEIDGALLSDKLKENAVFLKNIQPLKNALADDLINEFEKAYNEEVAKYQNI